MSVLTGESEVVIHDPGFVTRIVSAAGGHPRWEAGPAMSSHREAPEISKDPVADNTDLYAFVSAPIARNGDAHRQLHSTGRSRRAVRTSSSSPTTSLPDQHRQQRRRAGGHPYEFRFNTAIRTEANSFLYNTGPIDFV